MARQIDAAAAFLAAIAGTHRIRWRGGQRERPGRDGRRSEGPAKSGYLAAAL
jgi:hypothetical protein